MSASDPRALARETPNPDALRRMTRLSLLHEHRNCIKFDASGSKGHDCWRKVAANSAPACSTSGWTRAETMAPLQASLEGARAVPLTRGP